MIPLDRDPLLSRAFVLAQHLHRDQVRKGTTIPYLSHLLAVASLVLEDGGSEVAAAGGLLHDAAEDQGGRSTLDLIAARCGRQVAVIVEECSDAVVAINTPKPAWQERKEAFLDTLPTKSHDALLVIAADKLHNASATLTDLQGVGPAVWDRFKTGKSGFLWYHDRLAELLQQLLPDSRSLRELGSVMGQLHVLA